MSINVLAGNERILMRGAAMILLAGLVAGCSGGFSRFNGVDDVFTASTANQRQIFNQNQPYPGESQIAAAPVEGVQRGEVSRSTLSPAASQPLPAPQAPAAPRIAAAPAPAVSAPAMTMRAPDSNPKMVEAKPETSTRQDTFSQKAPLPAAAPSAPQPPKLAEAKPAPAGNAQGAYTVQSGDTLSSISRKTGIGVSALQAANGLQDGNIRIGQSLRIPSAGATTVAAVAPAAPAAPAKTSAPAADPVVTGTAGQATAPKAEKVAAYTPPRKTEKVIEQADDYDAPDSTGIGRMRWPVRGRVISAFGKGGGKANDGIDIQVPQGTPVKAAENGVVIYAGDGLKEFGNTVLVRHDNGLVTVYGHASELKVSRGDKVKRGQQIANSGMSGVADSPRLHFEVRKNSAPVDPTTFLE
jgi:murein DD-endopeptidase MepM/ murein hydrolase activator NlpD